MIEKQPMLGRRRFIKQFTVVSTVGGLGLSAHRPPASGWVEHGKRVGIIGLDTSHSVAFTELLNAAEPNSTFHGYRVVAAYPYGSRTIKTSFERIGTITDQMKAKGVEIMDTIDSLPRKVDVVLLETNDGRLHRDQALAVMQSGLPWFIDKPIAASYADAEPIFDAADRLGVPVFSSSSLRFATNVEQMANGAVGAVIGAETFSPAFVEPSHPDLFWYAIHGIEMLYAVMGMGCQRVWRMYSPGSEVMVGSWKDGRIGAFRGMRRGHSVYGGRVFGAEGIGDLRIDGDYVRLFGRICAFFESGKAPVSKEETLELVAFMEAAQRSAEVGGQPVRLEDIGNFGVR